MINISLSRTSADDLRRTARKLRQVGNAKAVRREMTKALRAAARPVVEAQRARVRSLRGAPREWKTDAGRATRIQIRSGGRAAGVAIVVRNNDAGRRGRLLNRGKWDHPTFGHDPRVTQTVRPGWFDVPPRVARPAVRRQVGRVLDGIERKLGD